MSIPSDLRVFLCTRDLRLKLRKLHLELSVPSVRANLSPAYKITVTDQKYSKYVF